MSDTSATPNYSSRRGFLGTLAAAGALAATSSGFAREIASDAPPAKAVGKLPLLKSVKWGMIADGRTVAEKFQICKELGFDGMELVSPADFSAEEVREASQATELPVHGLVDMKHWDVRLSSPEPKVREEAGAILAQAIRDAHAFGGFAVLLVPGKVTGPDENHDHVWQRSIAGIRQALPLASRLGVRILIENVWNGFCETPEQNRDYLDEIGSPWVGAYFDIGNVVNFSPSENWIRTLGPRMGKLDVTDYSHERGFDAKIGEGDVNWPEVRRALAEVRYSGWCTAEVSGGDRAWLADVAARMDRALINGQAG
jgi:hexulose-6-phosphate isomerase